MTEAEWLACTDPRPMLESLRGKASDRKLRLFAVACCHRAGSRLIDDGIRVCIEVAERFADGAASAGELEAAPDGFEYVPASRTDDRLAAWWTTFRDAWLAAHHTGRYSDPAVQCTALRDILGPLPFRPVVIDPAWVRWNHGTIPAIARRIYEERAFHDMPILADALEDAGCTDADLLAHCRTGGPHVRGCWVVDLLLGTG
jgi:hypothetical protein